MLFSKMDWKLGPDAHHKEFVYKKFQERAMQTGWNDEAIVFSDYGLILLARFLLFQRFMELISELPWQFARRVLPLYPACTCPRELMKLANSVQRCWLVWRRCIFHVLRDVHSSVRYLPIVC